MDKKGSRSVQPLSKGSATDSKKNQDVNKLWPRNGRRREPNGGAFPKNEASRKPILQRNKAVDKRPRSRGNYYFGAAGTENAWVETPEQEMGSVSVQGSKKQSLNHLLNFHFASREPHLQSASGHRLNSSVKHKYNKEQFLQANCQFIVQEYGDYKPYMKNPDALVDWNLIEQVNIHVLEFPSCPICLYPPVAAKMTRCGHIYCWSCVLHYLALSDNAYRKCPICYEAVHKKDLKSVVAIPHSTFSIKETITFKLMKRARDSFIAYPAEFSVQDNDVPIKVSNFIAHDIYSKLLVADHSEVSSIIQREKTELSKQLAEDENCPEKCFIEQALTLLNERSTILHNLDVESHNLLLNSKDTIHERYESTSSDTLSNEEPGATCEIDSEYSYMLPAAETSQKPSKYFYFYQAVDGQHIYMHALNIRMLEHTYGSLEHCPKTITGSILEKECGSMTEELRKRLRYLQHLPVTCQFEVAEIQLKSPIVNKETLEHFGEQIETRRKRRQRKAREEKRREKRITEEENIKMGKFVPANIKLESYCQFPEFQSEPINIQDHQPESSLNSDQSTSISDFGSSSIENERCLLSFAKMLTSSSASDTPWKIRKSTNIESVPSTINIGTSKTSQVKDGEPDIEGYIPAPVFNQSFGDAIALALEKAAVDNDGEAEKETTGKKKKKNKQKKILFATSMACSSN